MGKSQIIMGKPLLYTRRGAFKSSPADLSSLPPLTLKWCVGVLVKWPMHSINTGSTKDAKLHPPKNNIEPENDGLEDDFPFPVQGCILRFHVYLPGCIELVPVPFKPSLQVSLTPTPVWNDWYPHEFHELRKYIWWKSSWGKLSSQIFGILLGGKIGNRLMVNCWFGLLAWIPDVPLMKGIVTSGHP